MVTENHVFALTAGITCFNLYLDRNNRDGMFLSPTFNTGQLVH